MACQVVPQMSTLTTKSCQERKIAARGPFPS
jgi:hypothetical protein